MSKKKYRNREEDEEKEEEYEVEFGEEDKRGSRHSGGGGGKKRRRSEFIDDVAEEDEEEEEYDEEEEDEDEDFGDYTIRRRHKQRKRSGSEFFELEAAVDSDEDEEEEEEGEDDFIVDSDAELQDEDNGKRMHRPPLIPSEDDEQEDVEDLERRIQERYASSRYTDYDEETTDVEQQALLPSVKDPKLWVVRCKTGREREAAGWLMQKSIDKGPELQIRSVIALDNLPNRIYVEADKEAHVKEACKGINFINAMKVMLVPIEEMTDVLSVESKTPDLLKDKWVRVKIGIYKGDLAKVVNVDNVRRRVTVKLIPRIDLQSIANKLDGIQVAKKKAFIPPPRFMNIDEAKAMRIRIEHKKERSTGNYFDRIGGMMFKEGFLYKTVSMKSISYQNIRPTFYELDKFRKPGDGDMASLSALFSNRKKGHFMKGDAVIVVKGDLKNLMGWVEKVEEDIVHIRPKMKDLPKTLVNEKELCKYFKPGNHVKVVSGAQEGATGMVVKVEDHVLIIVSDVTKEDIRVFADQVVESSEVTSGVTKIKDYELHDLVLLDNMSFGVIIRLESEAFQVLKGVPGRSEVALVKLGEIKRKIERSSNAQDRSKNTLSVKDVVRVLDGPCKGKQGPIEHIYRGILFINDHSHLEHAGYICAKAQSCLVIGGSRANGDRNGGSLLTRFATVRAAPHIPASPRRMVTGRPPIDYGGRYRGGPGRDSLIGSSIKIRFGPLKGYRGRVVDVNGQSVRVELESQMKIVTGNRISLVCFPNIFHLFTSGTPRHGMGNETPMHPSRTPLHPFMTPMRDPGGATPIHEGMRTPMHHRAWNPYATPMSPASPFIENNLHVV
ncbi:Transcription elongation factor Spt5 [Macleaya cordata]|uniref:Transcription elongation factor SPT5 n=1 Tax=Macleaya cordata TaxID=56857 RepID=A0A200QAA4_MACCD|nr:Transcription elongation factor Spt5 [Macleaya cordata]